MILPYTPTEGEFVEMPLDFDLGVPQSIEDHTYTQEAAWVRIRSKKRDKTYHGCVGFPDEDFEKMKADKLPENNSKRKTNKDANPKKNNPERHEQKMEVVRKNPANKMLVWPTKPPSHSMLACLT